MTIYICPDSFDGILCGIYEAWMSRKGHANVKLLVEGSSNLEMFCDYCQVELNEEKMNKVIKSVQKKISMGVYELIFKASLSRDETRADKIYRFLIYGFQYGAGVSAMLHIPAVFDIFEICRFVGNEAHLLTEFTRFAQMEQGILMGKIAPKNDVLLIVAEHFADRMPGENWLLYDLGRQKAAVHQANQGWGVVRMDRSQWEHTLSTDEEELEYRKLWRAFHRSVAIKERYNPVCQRNHLPLRYRPYMTEFQSDK